MGFLALVGGGKPDWLGHGSLVVRATDRVVLLCLSETVGFAAGFGMIGAVSGVITGAALSWPMRNPISEVATLAPHL